MKLSSDEGTHIDERDLKRQWTAHRTHAGVRGSAKEEQERVGMIYPRGFWEDLTVVFMVCSISIMNCDISHYMHKIHHCETWNAGRDLRTVKLQSMLAGYQLITTNNGSEMGSAGRLSQLPQGLLDGTSFPKKGEDLPPLISHLPIFKKNDVFVIHVVIADSQFHGYCRFVWQNSR